MASPLAVLSEAAYAYEQMEKLNQLKVNKNNIFQVKVSRVHGDDGVFILNHYLNFFMFSWPHRQLHLQLPIPMER